MASSYDSLQIEPKLRVEIIKTGINFAVADRWYSTLTATGIPDAGTSTLSVQATGEALTRTTAGFPNPITTDHNDGTGAIGFDEATFSVPFSTTRTMRAKLFQAFGRYGTYNFNANTAVTDAATNEVAELWIEVVAAVTGTLNVTVTDDAANTFTASISAPAAGTWWQLRSTAAVDTGTITQVQATTASAGTFNVWKVRPLLSLAAGAGLPQNTTCRFGLNEFGANGLFANANTALLLLVRSTATGTIPIEFDCVTSRVEF